MSVRALPTWVRSHDGRLHPFDPDRVSRDLFAAAAMQSNADVVLIRELTTGVLHLLADGMLAPTVASADLAERIITLVRELGHPALALYLAERRQRVLPQSPESSSEETTSYPFSRDREHPRQPIATCDSNAIFPVDVQAALADRLLIPGGQNDPNVLDAALLMLGQNTGTFDNAIADMRRRAGAWIAVGGLETWLDDRDGIPETVVAHYFKQMVKALNTHGLSALINLNVAHGWSHDQEAAGWSLFNPPNTESTRTRLRAIQHCLLHEISKLPISPSRLAVAYHLSADDFAPGVHRNLDCVLDDITDLDSVQFVFDRATGHVDYGCGLAPNQPGVLSTLGINLPRIAERYGRNEESFLAKLAAVAALVRSAGHALWDALRKHGNDELFHGFYLDRSRLLVVPIGLEAVVYRFTGRRLCDAMASTILPRQVIAQLTQSLQPEPPRLMNSYLDSPIWQFGVFGMPRPGATVLPELFAGISPVDELATARLQILAAGELHALAGGGTAVVLSESQVDSPKKDTANLLRYAWQHTHCNRVVFHPLTAGNVT